MAEDSAFSCRVPTFGFILKDMENTFTWTGRDDGSGAEHRRWHNQIHVGSPDPQHTDHVCLIGFASDEGVRRNLGRTGAAAGPDALRTALSSLAITDDRSRWDNGTISCIDTDLEAAQEALSTQVATSFSAGAAVTVILGGGHETSFASHRGLRRSFPDQRIAIINLDAHFDLRDAPQPTSGTPFKQIATSWPADFNYHVFGISVPNNTKVLFDEAARLGTTFITDVELAATTPAAAAQLVHAIAAETDVLHLSIDLDVLPAAVAPGVSAPAAYGVPYPLIHAMCVAAAESGKLKLVDVVELNPAFDIDRRTANAAARLIHDITAHLLPAVSK